MAAREVAAVAAAREVAGTSAARRPERLWVWLWVLGGGLGRPLVHVEARVSRKCAWHLVWSSVPLCLAGCTCVSGSTSRRVLPSSRPQEHALEVPFHARCASVKGLVTGATV